MCNDYNISKEREMGSREREEFTNQYKRKVVPIEEGRRKLNEKSR